MNKEFNLSTGKKGEDLASEFLQKLGYKIIGRNIRYKNGEIDILALDGNIVVIVEVKTTKGAAFGDPIGFVNAKKQAKLKDLARNVLLAYPKSDIRIDVLGITLTGNSADFDYIRNAV